MLDLKFLSEPCRNFCFLSSIIVNDGNAGGAEKIVFSSFVAGGKGILVFIDPKTGDNESYEFPDDEGAWALCLQDDNTLLVGTCARSGYLHVFDIPSRTWLASYRTATETYIWNLVKASDGNVYGGTYGGCRLVKYDHSKGTLEDLGRMSENEGNLYSRTVYPDLNGDGNIVIACMSATNDLVVYNIYENKIVGTTKKQPVLPQANILADGTTFRTDGQEYVLTKNGVDTYYDFTVTPPPTAILGLTTDENGVVWGSSGFGQTIFSYDPKTGANLNTKGVCSSGGEVYGIQAINGKIYTASYAGADTTKYDPTQPWNQRENLNPKTVANAKPYIRPTGFSTLGPDGNFWTGWQSGYGTYGGGYSRLDVNTDEQTLWKNPVSEQAVSSLTAGDKYLYFTTDNSANGLLPKAEDVHLCVIDTDGNLVKDVVYKYGYHLHKPCFFNGKVYVPVNGALHIYDELLENCEVKTFENKIYELYNLPMSGKMLAVFNDMTAVVDENGEIIEKVYDKPLHGRITIAKDEKIYITQESKLYEVIIS
ncbi:MAG: WD40 repeat domain-containing protein [Oscillospiraceae bacterium]|nr:WD40 repeat domain-containing protein [Oscillospiraceae bacterium]